jgi:hypothetical protein
MFRRLSWQTWRVAAPTCMLGAASVYLGWVAGQVTTPPRDGLIDLAGAICTAVLTALIPILAAPKGKERASPEWRVMPTITTTTT